MTEQVTEADLPHLRRCVELATEAAEAGDFPFGSVLGRAGTHRVRNLIGATGPLARRPGSQPGPGPAPRDHGGGSPSGEGRSRIWRSSYATCTADSAQPQVSPAGTPYRRENDGRYRP